MSATHFALFDTAIGRCGIAWSDKGVAAVQLPERREGETRRRLARRSAGVAEARPTAEVQAVIDAIATLLNGGKTDLSAVAVDLDGVADFDRRVLAVTLTIQPGDTMTYGQIAARLGEPGAARAVGAALGRNPIPIIVPCHRVLGADGKPGGFSAPGGIATKARLLSIEGARTTAEPMLFEALPIAVRPHSRA